MSTKQKIQLPSLSNYGNASSNNYGFHTIRVDLGPLTIWYSYKTPVAFRVLGHDKVVHENVWSTTTGKHLNMIESDKKRRVNSERFEQLWNEQVAPLLSQE